MSDAVAFVSTRNPRSAYSVTDLGPHARGLFAYGQTSSTTGYLSIRPQAASANATVVEIKAMVKPIQAETFPAWISVSALACVGMIGVGFVCAFLPGVSAVGALFPLGLLGLAGVGMFARRH